jgi:hypothetical protein
MRLFDYEDPKMALDAQASISSSVLLLLGRTG